MCIDFRLLLLVLYHIDDTMQNEYDSEDTDDDDIPLLQDLDHLELSKEIKHDTQPSEDDINTNTNNTNTQSQNKVPVTILTGFLGSGKTTLVKHILTSNQHNYKIAVIENEYGGGENDKQLAERLGLTVNDISTLSVETMIAKDGTDGTNLADFIELPNGCVCCTVKDSLVETLENLLSKRTDLDYVIIEASGMADPGPVASIFWLDEALDSRIQLDGIICCIDAKNICNQLRDTSSSSGAEHDGGGDEAARQIAFADRIIINKVDLLQQPQQNNSIESVLQEIKSINPTAPTKQTTYSNIEDINWILNAECFDAERVKDVESAFQQSSTETSDFASPLFLATLNQHQHTNAVGTIALFARGSVDLTKINSWLATLLWPDQDEKDSILRARLEADLASGNTSSHISTSNKKKKQRIYRIKGVLSVAHGIDKDRKVIPQSNDFVDEGLTAGLVCSQTGTDRRRFIVQAVNDLWDTLPSQNLHWSTSDTRCCKIVVIGKWLNEEQLQKGFDDCFVSLTNNT